METTIVLMISNLRKDLQNLQSFWIVALWGHLRTPNLKPDVLNPAAAVNLGNGCSGRGRPLTRLISGLEGFGWAAVNEEGPIPSAQGMRSGDIQVGMLQDTSIKKTSSYKPPSWVLPDPGHGWYFGAI